MNELALFAGAGGGILGGKLLGWNTVGAVEIEEYPRAVLLQRQRDGILPFFPIWDDITTFEGGLWKGCVDIISGGFPCQDISAAGKGVGIEGERSGLWGEMARVIDEVRPQFAFVENSPMLTIRGLGRVLGDLSEMGYNARWCVLGADDAGAPHRRKRIWILAYSNEGRQQKRSNRTRRETGSEFGRRCEKSDMADTDCIGTERNKSENREGGRVEFKGEMADTCTQRSPTRISEQEQREEGNTDKPINGGRITWWDTDPADMADSEDSDGRRTDGKEDSRRGTQETGRSDINRAWEEYRPTEPVMGRVAHGVAHRVDKLKAIGNGQVPAVAALAFTILSEGLT